MVGVVFLKIKLHNARVADWLVAGVYSGTLLRAATLTPDYRWGNRRVHPPVPHAPGYISELKALWFHADAPDTVHSAQLHNKRQVSLPHSHHYNY